MVLKLYYDVISPPVRAVHLAIKYLNIPVELVDISCLQGMNRSEEYLKVNPQGKIPSINDDGFVLHDSHAINIYLVTKYGKDDKLYPSDATKRAVVNQRLFFDTGELFPALRKLAVSIIRKGATCIDDESLEEVQKIYEIVEIYLQENEYVAGNELTIADFSIISTLSSMNEFIPISKKQCPQLLAYLERAKTWPHYVEVTEPGVKAIRELLKIKDFVHPS